MEKHGVIKGEGDEPQAPPKQAQEQPRPKPACGADAFSKAAEAAAEPRDEGE